MPVVTAIAITGVCSSAVALSLYARKKYADKHREDQRLVERLDAVALRPIDRGVFTVEEA